MKRTDQGQCCQTSMIVGYTARHTNADFVQRQSFDQFWPFSAKNTSFLYVPQIRFMGPIFNIVMVLNTYQLYVMLRRRSSTFLLPLCLMYQLLLDGWSLHGITKKKRRPTGSLEQVTLKSRPFFIYLRTYLALRMRRSFFDRRTLSTEQSRSIT